MGVLKVGLAFSWPMCMVLGAGSMASLRCQQASLNDTHSPRLLLRDQDKSEHAEDTKAHPNTLYDA